MKQDCSKNAAYFEKSERLIENDQEKNVIVLLRKWVHLRG